ncbi:expressed unknown protein [Seminavis robusta]|uniref:Uncharacterized protein n=1 Tax=Seminavis robusta TaxID=568900 RepID=A0A9N8EJ91_9STRA|nr:expressed unknown protein [Seminavis robusta]|eukprot:Sro1169_g248580.2  (236) ;mRNA; r:3352-4059
MMQLLLSFLLLQALVGSGVVPAAEAFSPLQLSTSTHSKARAVHGHVPGLSLGEVKVVKGDGSEDFGSKNEEAEPISFSRRQWVSTVSSFSGISMLGMLVPPVAAAAEEEPVYYDASEVEKAFAAIRFELEDPSGGIAFLQGCVDKTDYESILEFTKTYDLELRKAKMMAAKKKFKFGGEQAIQLLNNVTFDLIGMNKSCRKGQENIQLTQKYLSELKEDVAKYLEFQKTVLVAQS